VNLALVRAAAVPGSPFASYYPIPDDPVSRASFFGTFAVIGTWAVLGLVWTPLNAYGLWKRRPWARLSTLIYWGGSILTCCSLPLGIYGLVSMLRKDVAVLLRGPERMS
jgi:hypothetical protein